MKNNRFLTHVFAFGCIFLMLLSSQPQQVAASPWAEKEGYGAKTGGKLAFGLKHTLFSWMNPWAEAHDTVYETPWTGFCAGIGKAVVYTATGLIHLVTFPIPIDFPNVGLGMHIPANHQGVVVKSQITAGDQSVLDTAGVEAGLDTDVASAMEAASISEASNVPKSTLANPDNPAGTPPSELAKKTTSPKSPTVIK